MSISANVTSQTITASVSGTTIAATVGASTISTTASGGIGPPGASVSNLGDLADVQLTNTQTGDVLRRNGGVWANYSELDLLDGGNA